MYRKKDVRCNQAKMKGNRDNRYYVVWLYKGLRRFCRLILWKGRETPNEERKRKKKKNL